MELSGQLPSFHSAEEGKSCTVYLRVRAVPGGAGGRHHPACFEGDIDEEVVDLLEVGLSHDGQWVDRGAGRSWWGGGCLVGFRGSFDVGFRQNNISQLTAFGTYQPEVVVIKGMCSR